MWLCSPEVHDNNSLNTAPTEDSAWLEAPPSVTEIKGTVESPPRCWQLELGLPLAHGQIGASESWVLIDSDIGEGSKRDSSWQLWKTEETAA